ncbi:SBBP repeat-containing protein, partial [bacterium]|nr:SBBP repeat-containing protein [bacterium]
MRAVRLLVVVTALSLLAAWAGAQEPYEEWVARYDGPDHLLDSGSSVGVDALGNVYVAGNSNTPHGSFISDYVTIAYGSDGVELWLDRYDGPAGYHDYVRGMAVDSAGNVYVTGESAGSGTLSDYATIMYDASGSRMWVARYNGPGGRNDEATAVALYGDGGVCVTGHSYGSADTDYDYATIRYNSAGDELWVARYSNDPVLGNDHASAVAVATDGSVYVTGHSWGDGTAEDFATVKYAPDGHEEWVARYNGPDDGDDRAEAVAVDDLGNVYVTGRSWADASEYDYTTIKYDSGGNEKWVARYNGPGNTWDLAWDLVLDGDGSSYVTGSSHTGG